jgi:hypothetical protein
MLAVGNLGVQYEGFSKNNQSVEGSVNYFSFSNYCNLQTEGASVYAAYGMYFNEALDHKGFLLGRTRNIDIRMCQMEIVIANGMTTMLQ